MSAAPRLRPSSSDMEEAIMSKTINKEDIAILVADASEMFDETGCVPGIDGEEVPAERMVPHAKQYISETIDDSKALFDSKIWDTPGLRWSFRGCHKNGCRNAKSLHLAALRILISICPRNSKTNASTRPRLS